MALTSAQLTDARRFLGYQVPGTTMAITGDQDLVYIVYGMTIMSLYTRLTNLSADELTVTTTYLTNLNTLEAAIPAAGSNLDTDTAAVWKHNKDEVSDRTSLFNQYRRAFCGFLGVNPGPALGSGGGISISRA